MMKWATRFQPTRPQSQPPKTRSRWAAWVVVRMTPHLDHWQRHSPCAWQWSAPRLCGKSPKKFRLISQQVSNDLTSVTGRSHSHTITSATPCGTENQSTRIDLRMQVKLPPSEQRNDWSATESTGWWFYIKVVYRNTDCKWRQKLSYRSHLLMMRVEYEIA